MAESGPKKKTDIIASSSTNKEIITVPKKEKGVKYYDLYKNYAMTPDNELLLWENWIKIRTDEAVGLGKTLKEPPVDLVMNLLEKTREQKEWKTALEHAQAAGKSICFNSTWGKGYRLNQKCVCCNVYETFKTPVDLGHPHVLEHIRVPDYIQKTEKGLVGIPERVEAHKLDVDFNEYKAKREQELKATLKKIDPYDPDMKNLIIIGSKPKTPPPKIPPLPPIVVTTHEEPYQEALMAVYSLRINNTVILKEIPNQSVPTIKKMQQEPWHKFCYSWQYYFNVPARKIGKGTLFLQNLGTVTLRYCWKKVIKPIPFIPDPAYDQYFYFNKNEDVISPGQQKEIIFTFVSELPGIYSEMWELCILNIGSMFDAIGKKLTVKLVGDSLEKYKKITMNVDKLQYRINRKAMKRLIRKWLTDAVNTATSTEVEYSPYKDFLLEKEIFLLKNPVCYYHQSEVQKLKEVYAEMTGGAKWNLSIATWRHVMISKNFDERMMYFNTLKTSHNLVLLKPWEEGDELLKEKYRMVKIFLGMLTDKFYDEKERCSYPGGPAGDGAGDSVNKYSKSTLSLSPPTVKLPQIVMNIFYMRMWEHVADFIETIAGVLSGIDSNRWINFDFCAV